MVMVTRSSHKKSSESSQSSNLSQKDIIPPPWCSLAKGHERKKARRLTLGTWERRSLSPLRENICQYLDDKRKLHKRKHRPCCKETPKGNKGRGKTLLSLVILISLGIISFIFWDQDYLPKSNLLANVIPTVNLISLLNIKDMSVEEECCSRMQYLLAELLRAEQSFTNLKLRRRLMLSSKNSKTGGIFDRSYVEGAEVSKGAHTVSWGSRMALWGVVPLWRAALPPRVVLTRRPPVPADCWPFGGSFGELLIDLPRPIRIRAISLEHVQPDVTLSAPKEFILYGILSNGTYLKAVESAYKPRSLAKQYFMLAYNNVPIQHFIFSVLSNQGNTQYTCIYRLHLYENVDYN